MATHEHLPGIALCAAVLAALGACRAAAPRVIAPEVSPPPALEPDSTDWHGLLIAPFGSVLRDIPLTLHEVLLFREEAHGSAATSDAGAAECYAADAKALRFLERAPDEYLLCLTDDRLSRIEASLRLPAADSAAVFAAACAAWLRNAAPPAAGSTASGPGTTACEGRDGAIRFRGRLDEESVLSITLDDVADP